MSSNPLPVSVGLKVEAEVEFGAVAEGAARDPPAVADGAARDPPAVADGAARDPPAVADGAARDPPAVAVVESSGELSFDS